jgi:hypothetical protein
LFDKLDRDHGTLDKRELARRLTPKEFAAADPDHDGTLTKTRKSPIARSSSFSVRSDDISI